MNVARLAEWGKKRLPDWNLGVRRAVALAARQWQSAHRLPSPPLEWGGADGATLLARQWVGVVEVEGHRVEIYPKLDAALLGESSTLDETLATSTLRALLPMLDAAGFGEWVETGSAELGLAPLSFADIWAYLLGKHLGRELKRGLASAYLEHRDDLPAVRGKVMVARQVAANFNRFDRIACGWDEFTPDIPLNRLLKCACATLRRRASHPVARGLLGDCLFALDEVSDVSPATALRETERLVWSRPTQRFEPPYALARRILRELSPELGGEAGRTWTFLVDMNAVFEGFCAAALAAHFGVAVEEQLSMGTLFHSPNRLRQIADFVWSQEGRWIGDAKWKLLGQNAPDFDETGLKTAALSPADVRQLTVYAELLKRRDHLEAMPQLAILYPLLGTNANPQLPLQTWNDTKLHVWPVRVRGWKTIGEALLVPIEIESATGI